MLSSCSSNLNSGLASTATDQESIILAADYRLAFIDKSGAVIVDSIGIEQEPSGSLVENDGQFVSN